MVEIRDLSKTKSLKRYYKDIKDYYLKTLKVLKLKDDFEVTLIIVSNSKIKSINKKFRNIDSVTDVISFAEIDSDDEFGDNSYLGDIFINEDRVKSQSKLYKHSLKREFCFLFIHGILHLFGYDHMNKKDEKKMFSLQDKIIGDLK